MAVVYLNNSFDHDDQWEVRQEPLSFVMFLYEVNASWDFLCNESVLIIF